MLTLSATFKFQSGAIINNWATKPADVMLDMSMMLARRLNCSHPLLGPPTAGATAAAAINVADIVQCISSKSTAVILREAENVGAALALPMTFPFVPIEQDVNFFQVGLFGILFQSIV